MHAPQVTGDDAALNFAAVLVDAIARAGGQPHAGGLYSGVEFLIHIRRDQIVGIDKADVVAAGVVQSHVAGAGRAAVLLVENADAGIGLG